MRLVLDTNVLVAAFIARGTCHELLEYCVRHHTIVASSFILDEFRRTLLDKMKLKREDVEEAAAMLRDHFEWVEPVMFTQAVSRDPDDDVVLGTAVAGACMCLVTGDKDLLDVAEYEEIVMVSPADFWAFEAMH